MPKDTNIQSNYWKINNEHDCNITNADAVYPTNIAMSKEADTLAVSSNALNENLKIFHLTNNSLIHLASVTFPDIHTLKFLKPVSEPPYDFKFLLSGHSNGIMHLSTIPLTEGSIYENAEIIKRFNHKKALETIRDTKTVGRKSYILNNGLPSTTIASIDLSSSTWTSSSLNSSVVVYDHHLFYWDTTKSTKPISILGKPGISNAVTNKHMDSLTAAVGDFGLSMMDLRMNGYNQSSIKLNESGYTSAHWCESNENLLATVSSDPNIVQLWDIRNLKPFNTLNEFSGKINDLKWRENILWIAQSSGKLSKWDIANARVSIDFDSRISESGILSLELNDESSNVDEVVCIDPSNISTHKTYKKKQLSSHSSKLSPYQTISSYSESNRAVSDTPASYSSNLFEFRPNDRRGSDETLAVSSRTGDYLIDFQKEVSEMIQQMDTITINNIVYL